MALRLPYLVFVRLLAEQTRHTVQHGPSQAFWVSAPTQMKVYGSAARRAGSAGGDLSAVLRAALADPRKAAGLAGSARALYRLLPPVRRPSRC